MFFLDNPQFVVSVGYVTMTMLTLFFTGLALFFWNDSRN